MLKRLWGALTGPDKCPKCEQRHCGRCAHFGNVRCMRGSTPEIRLVQVRQHCEICSCTDVELSDYILHGPPSML